MLHNRQAPGRDFHKHFSLAPARSDTNPPSNPQSAPAPSPLQDRAQARNATSRAPHLSLIPLAPPAPPRLRPPTPAPLPPLCPPSTSIKRRLERHMRNQTKRRRRTGTRPDQLRHHSAHPPPAAFADRDPTSAYCLERPDSPFADCAWRLVPCTTALPTSFFASVVCIDGAPLHHHPP